MAYMKTTTENVVERMQFNTTVNAKLFLEFKNFCRETGVPLNIWIEAFMENCLSGDIGITIYKKRSGSNRNSRIEFVFNDDLP